MRILYCQIRKWNLVVFTVIYWIIPRYWWLIHWLIHWFFCCFINSLTQLFLPSCLLHYEECHWHWFIAHWVDEYVRHSRAQLGNTVDLFQHDFVWLTEGDFFAQTEVFLQPISVWRAELVLTWCWSNESLYSSKYTAARMTQGAIVTVFQTVVLCLWYQWKKYSDL